MRKSFVKSLKYQKIQALDYMEEHLAPGSHVVLVGLIDAGFLYKVIPFKGFNNLVELRDSDSCTNMVHQSC